MDHVPGDSLCAVAGALDTSSDRTVESRSKACPWGSSVSTGLSLLRRLWLPQNHGPHKPILAGGQTESIVVTRGTQLRGAVESSEGDARLYVSGNSSPSHMARTSQHEMTLIVISRVPFRDVSRSSECATFANAHHAAVKTRNLPPDRGCCMSLRIGDLRSATLAWNSRALVAATEMHIASAVSRIERSCNC